jgi:hAT family C-terminal dimerisation region
VPQTISLELRLREPQPNVQVGQLSLFKKKTTAKQRTDDTYQRYAGCDPEMESVADDALGYWNAARPDSNPTGYSTLLAVPMSGAECERIFSSAKPRVLVITSSRNRLRPDTIEASECLRNWLDKLIACPRNLTARLK